MLRSKNREATIYLSSSGVVDSDAYAISVLYVHM